MVAVVATASYQVRRVRNRWIEDVLPVWIVEEDDTNDDDENDEMTDSSSSSSWKIEYPNRTLDSILSAVQRAGLMGQKHVSVKEELDHIRKWHVRTVQICIYLYKHVFMYVRNSTHDSCHNSGELIDFIF